MGVMQRSTGMLPGGYWDAAGELHREFELAVLTGREEELLAQSDGAETAPLVSAVLSRACGASATSARSPRTWRAQLLVADRQYLLLKLRQQTFGDLVRASLYLPVAGLRRNG